MLLPVQKPVNNADGGPAARGHRHGILLSFIGCYLAVSFWHGNGDFASSSGFGMMEATTNGEASSKALTESKDASTTSTSPTEGSTSSAAPLLGAKEMAIKKRNTWDSLVPLQHSNVNNRKLMPPMGEQSDTYNYFHHYLTTLHEGSGITNFPELPLWDTWWPYAEAYHNHFARFRGTQVTFMEVGVQSGGKIALLRDYFGPGLEYIGIDINPSTQKFQNPKHPWVHIEIGDSRSPEFWLAIKQKYQHVDIFLDDGGHAMEDQIVTMEHMLPHVQVEGIFICEDLSTSWSPPYGGRANKDARHAEFVETTMVGLIHKSLDWFMYGYMPGENHWQAEQVPDTHWVQQKAWWKVVPSQVKHIHYYKNLVVYEKGVTPTPKAIRTVGNLIPYGPSGEHPPTDWTGVLQKLQNYTNSPWKW